MKPKYKVGDVVQMDLAVKKYFRANAPRNIVEKVYDNSTEEFPETDWINIMVTVLIKQIR